LNIKAAIMTVLSVLAFGVLLGVIIVKPMIFIVACIAALCIVLPYLTLFFIFTRWIYSLWENLFK